MENILEYFSLYIDLDDQLIEVVRDSFKKRKYQKGDHLLKEGEVCDFIGFVGEGAFRLYTEKDGVVKNFDFIFENGILTDYRSFLSGLSSEFYIEAMKSSEIFIISKTKQLQNLNSLPKWERLTRILTEELYMYENERFYSLLNHTPEERYNRLLKKDPDLLQKVSQTHLATYLGITRETLSRIRARIS